MYTAQASKLISQKNSKYKGDRHTKYQLEKNKYILLGRKFQLNTKHGHTHLSRRRRRQAT